MLRFSALLSLILGAIAATGFAPLNLWPLSLAGFAIWLRLVHDAPTMRRALWLGWLFGVGHFSVNDNWIQHAFDFQQQMPPVLGYAAPVLLALYLAVYPMLAAALAWRFASPRSVGDTTTRPGGAYVLVFAAAWIATEYLRATMFTGYAWDPLGVIWLPTYIAFAAAWFGTYALSGLAVLTAGGLMLAAQRNRAAAIALAGGAAALALPALIRPALPPSGPGLLRVVQPNIGQDQRGETDGELMYRSLANLSGKPGPRPRLLLWPEGVVREFIEDGYPRWIYTMPPSLARYRMARLLGPRDMLLTGGAALQFDRAREPETATNSVYAITPYARIAGRYDKIHLVPYGEYLPMRPLLSALGLSRLVPGDIDFRDGEGPKTLPIPGFGGIGFQLCYEIIFSGEVVDPVHRPRLLFNPSNDAWFGRWGPPQHLAQARMRALEEGVPIVRATPTGISAVIDAEGDLLAHLPLGTRGAIELPIPAALPATPFARLGNIIAALVVAALLLAAVAIRRRAR